MRAAAAPQDLVTLQIEDRAPAAVPGVHGDVHVALQVVVAVSVREDVGGRIVTGGQLHASAHLDVPAAADSLIEQRHAGQRRDIAEPAAIFVRPRRRTTRPRRWNRSISRCGWRSVPL
jgi:hypothetical protein